MNQSDRTLLELATSRMDASPPPRGGVGSRVHHVVSALLIGGSLALGAMGCASGGDDDVASSQTHWLQQCDSDDDCEDLQCECGVCTTSCKDEDACSDLGGEATCSETQGLASCGSKVPEMICLQQCSDDECGENSECVDGVCVPDGSSGGDDGADDTNGDDTAGDDASADGSSDDDTAADDSSDDDASADDTSADDSAADASADDTSADDSAADDSAADDSAADDAAADDGADDGSQANEPPGVMCSDYPSCGVDEFCDAAENCIMFEACGGALCIPSEEACALSCPDPNGCAIAESYPEQLFCEGKVDAILDDGSTDDSSADDSTTDDTASDDSMPDDTASDDTAADDGSDTEPMGVNCGEHAACGVDGPACEAGSDCIAISGCTGAVCIPSAEACELSCPDPTECAILESFPEQISCPGRVDGYEDPPGGGGIDLDLLQSACGADDSCPEGLTALTYFGIAGPSGPEFCSCEIPCADDPNACPEGSSCQTIADGPGEVCVRSEPPGVPCGDGMCAADETCCDKCIGTCVNALSGANCPDDNDPDRVCPMD